MLAAAAAVCAVLAAGCAGGGVGLPGRRPSAAGATRGSASAAPLGSAVTLVSGAAPSTTTGRFDSLLAHYLPRYLPGHPTVRVDSMGGSGSQAAANHVYGMVRSDGRTLLAASDPVTPWVVQAPAVGYDASRFVWVGGVPGVYVQFVRASAGLQSVGDLRGYIGTLVLGGLGPGRRLDLESRLYLDLLDIQYRYVTGYGGGAALSRAVRSGAVTFTASSIGGYDAADLPMQKAGLVVPLSQSGLVDSQGRIEADPRSSLPTDVQVIRRVTGRTARGAEYDALVAVSAGDDVDEALALPPATPGPLAAVWREAVRQVFADPGFVAAARQVLGEPPTLTPGSEAGAVLARVAALLQQNPGVPTLLRQMASVTPK